MKFLISSVTLLTVGLAQQTCTVCSETMIERNKPRTITDPTALLPNKGCWDSIDAGDFETESCAQCYALFFNTRGVDAEQNDFYVLHAERGCVHDRVLVGKNVTSFPTATECNPVQASDCQMQLNKDNFGNFGSLNALYVVGNAADTLDVGQQKIAANKYDGMKNFNQVPLRCHQCDSLFSEANNACFQNPPAASDCEDFNATSCYSETSSYSAYDSSTNSDRTFYYAKRGCSRMSSQLAGGTDVREITRDLPVVPMVIENQTVQRRVKIEHCATAGCNKAKMDYVSTSDGRIVGISAAFFLLLWLN